MTRIVTISLVATLLSLAACGEGVATLAEPVDAGPLVGADETKSVDDPLTASFSAGAVLETKAPLNLRSGPDASHDILLTMPNGARCAVIKDGPPQNGWYYVAYGGKVGWAWGGYLKFHACPAGTRELWSCNESTGELLRCTTGLVERSPCADGCQVLSKAADDVCRTATPPSCPAGTVELWTCSSGTNELVRCTNGVVERQACSYGCNLKPLNENDTCKDAPACPAGTVELWSCFPDTNELVRCIDGVVERQACSYGCNIKPLTENDTCKDAPACPPQTVELWSCFTDTNELVRCIDGVVERQACPHGCNLKPLNENDTCKPPPCPAGTVELWSCFPDTNELVRCINGVVERQACSYGCNIKPLNENDTCKAAPNPEIVLPYTWSGQVTGYFCGPASTMMALSTRMTNPPNQWTLASYLGTTEYGTNHIGLVANALNHYLGTANSFYSTRSISDPATQAQIDQLRNDIAANIRAGYPLVANVVSGWRPPGYPTGITIYHYVAIVGYDSQYDTALVADSAGACAGGTIFCNVPKAYWVTIKDLGIWIGGKGYAY